MRRDRLLGMAAERLAVTGSPADPDHLEPLRQQPAEPEVVDRGQQLPCREIPGSAEDHERRRPGKRLRNVLGEWVSRRPGAHAGRAPGLADAATGSDSSSSSRASSAAPRTPASGPWRASLISVHSPTPGRMKRRAASVAGPRRSSPAVETPPPIATTSGSKALIAFAIPTPR